MIIDIHIRLSLSIYIHTYTRRYTDDACMRVRALYIYICILSKGKRERDVCERFELSVLGARHVCEFGVNLRGESQRIFGQGPQG